MRHLATLSLVCLWFVGCGYHFRAEGEPLGMQIESLAIPLFSSTSSEIGFEADFTKVIRHEFISHSRVPLVPEENAHMVLVGRIKDITTDPLAYRSEAFTIGGVTSTEYVTSSRQIRIRLDVQLLDRRSGKVIWRDASMLRQSSYSVSSDPLETRHNERRALENIAGDLAKILYMRTLRPF